MWNSIRALAVAAGAVASAVGIAGGASALAADLKVLKAPPKLASWWDTFEISGHVEGGITGNSVRPADGLNFGHLFTDRANTFLLNQALLTIQRPLDPKATGFDAGFKFQAMYGTDARYTHFLGEFDQSISSRNQVDIVEAYAAFHLPWVNSVLDVMTGIVTGVNTTFGNSFNCFNCGDNNHAVGFHGGLGFNLLDGKLTIAATTHIGPENPNVSQVVLAGVDPNRDLRYLNDVTITFKATDKLTFITDLNYIRDDGFGATGGGVAQYAAYAINDWLKIVGRGEIWRDNNGFFVAAFPGNLDFVMAEHGNPNAVVISGGSTTCAAVTGGLNITPELTKGGAVKALIFRPEVRYDWAGTKRSQFTFGGDVIAKF